MHAANPAFISFQGKVVNADGTNVANGSYNFDFVMYSDITLGTPSDGVYDKWHELSKSVTVTNGVFQTSLGSSTALIDFNSNPSLYLAIRFNADAAGYMSPRVQMASVPYALNADKVGGVAASSIVQLGVTQSGNINISSGTITSGNINGQTISSSSNFTGTLAVAGASSLKLGTASSADGSIIFRSSGGANAITIQAPSTNPTAAYTLKLPTTAPTLSQCLQNDGTTVGQLIFASCSGGGADSITVNGTAATDANFLNTTASASVAGTTFAINTASNPDDITLTISDASGSLAGVITANAQTIGGLKTFSDSIALGSVGGTTGSLAIKGTTSGTVTLTTAAAAGTYTWQLPTADSAGCIKSDGAGSGGGTGVLSIAACGDTFVDTITATGSGTWTKKTNALLVIVDAIAAGGGGGGGASNTGAIVRTGGSGGGGGAHARKEYAAADLGATENYSVGAGGLAGTAGASGTAGGSGGIGGNTTFGTVVRLFAGGGGGGKLGDISALVGGGGGGGGTGSAGTTGTTAVGAGGGPGTGATASGGNGSITATAGVGSEWGGGGGGGHTNVPANSTGGTSVYGGGGGGVGGGATSTPAVVVPTAGGNTGSYNVNGGGGGAAGTSGLVPTAGAAGAAGNSVVAGYGGGGGGSTVTAAVSGAAGGAGGAVGGGGGGGGSGSNTGTGGLGGVGGRGELRIYTVRGSGADLAEVYCTNDVSIKAGDTVSIDPALHAGVKKTAGTYDPKAIGIISTNPGMTTGDVEESCTKPVLVALTGRVPVKVSLENGPINVGDYLTTSSVSGVAMRSTKAGQVIGQALNSYDGAGPEYIVAFVVHGQSTGSTLNEIISASTAQNDLNKSVSQLALEYFMAYKDKVVDRTQISEITTDRVNAGLEIITPSVISDKIAANSIVPSTSGNITISIGANNKLIFKNKDGSESFTMDEAGKAKFGLSLSVLGEMQARGNLIVDGDSSFKGNVAFAKMAQFIGDTSFSGSINAQGRVTFNSDAGGIAIIKKGASRVDVAFTVPFTQSPIISASLAAEQVRLADGTNEDVRLKEQRLFNSGYNYLISSVTTKGFTIVLNKNTTEDIQLNWTSISIKDAVTTSSQPGSEIVTSEVTNIVAP